MLNKKTNNLIEFLLSTENETNEEVREYLKEAGIEPDEAIQKALDALKRRRAERKKQEGKRKQEEFNSKMMCTVWFKSEEVTLSINGYQVQYRDGEKISNDDKENAEETDRKAMEVFRQINAEER